MQWTRATTSSSLLGARTGEHGAAEMASSNKVPSEINVGGVGGLRHKASPAAKPSIFLARDRENRKQEHTSKKATSSKTKAQACTRQHDNDGGGRIHSPAKPGPIFLQDATASPPTRCAPNDAPPNAPPGHRRRHSPSRLGLHSPPMDVRGPGQASGDQGQCSLASNEEGEADGWRAAVDALQSPDTAGWEEESR